MPAMKRSFVAAGAAATLALALAAPLSAAAQPHPYTPLKPDTWRITIHPGTIVTHPVPDATFDDNITNLQLAVTGNSPSPSLALFTASQFGAQLASGSNGGATIKLNFGMDARGVYDVTLTQPGTENNSYGVVTVITDDAAPTAVTKAVPPAANLARTGTSIEFGVLWGAGAAVVAGILFWVISRVRRGSRLH